jgi:hypothetical protein
VRVRVRSAQLIHRCQWPLSHTTSRSEMSTWLELGVVRVRGSKG